MAPNVTLHFFAANDISGSVVYTLTDEDPAFRGLTLKLDRSGLGGGELLLSRAAGEDFAFPAESFARILIASYSDTDYYPWGLFLNKRLATVIDKDEDGGEVYRFGGAGPKMYLDRGRLGIGGALSGWNVDLANGVWRWGNAATVGRILERIRAQDSNMDDPALGALTLNFDETDDSNGVAWTDTSLGAGDAPYTIPIGTSMLQSLYDFEDLIELSSWIDLGTVASPKYELNVIQGVGEDVTGSSFGAGVCLLREGDNIANNGLTVEGHALRKASHVIVEGADGAWVVVERLSFTPGDYVKYAKTEFPRTSQTNLLTKSGLRWLQRQDLGEREYEIDILPGADDAAGAYFPAPDRVLWLNNLISLDTSAVGTTPTLLDIGPSTAQLVTGIELKLGEASDDSTDLKKARSWYVKVNLNRERSGTLPKTPDQRSAASGGGGCSCRSCTPGVEVNVLLGLSGAAVKASSEWSGRPAEDAFDGDDSTGEHWSADITEGVIGEWVAADLGEAKAVSMHRVKQGYSVSGPAAPEGADEMRWYASNDPADWAALVDGTQASFVPGDWTLVQTFSGSQTGSDTGKNFFSSEQEYRYWVLYAADGPGPGTGDAWNVQEAELWQIVPGDGNPICHGIIESGDHHPEYVREADADWVELTDGGETALHSHAGGGGGLGAWTAYTPTVTASTTNPTIASGNRKGRYKALDSKTYAIQIQINFVTGDNAGSGTWIISLPAGLTVAGLDQQLAGRLHDAGSRYYVCTGTVAAGATTIGQIVHTETGSNGQVAHNAPFTWANGDQLFLTGIIEVA